MNGFFSSFGFSEPGTQMDLPTKPPLKLSSRTLRQAIEDALIYAYTRVALESVLAEELQLEWAHDYTPADCDTKRSVVAAYTTGWGVPQMVGLARRIVIECEIPEQYANQLNELIALYGAGGGVAGASKNLIFAANGPKPQIVLRDAMNNDIQIVENAEYCLAFEDPVPAEGLRFSHLVSWWREQADLGDSVSDREVGLVLHDRLRASLDSEAERVVFDAYAARYRPTFDITALIPQVYLHYDPYDQHVRRASGAVAPLARQRMDFLLLFSDRRRVVIEVDGKQHYAEGDKASPELYARMVAEDRRLRLAGYEVYRFGGAELFKPDTKDMLSVFFDQLVARMA